MDNTYNKLLDKIQNISKLPSKSSEDFFQKIVLELFIQETDYKDIVFLSCDKEKGVIQYEELTIVGTNNTNSSIELRALKYRCINLDTKWGMLFNPKGIWLINTSIKTDNSVPFRNEQIVLEIKYGKNTNKKYFKYFLAENVIGSKQNANFYRDIINFKNTAYQGKSESWVGYHSTLKRMLDFYAEHKGDYGDYGESVYNQMDPAFFLEYVEKATNTRSKNSVKNAYHHVSGFLNEYSTQGVLNISPEKLISEIPNLSSKAGWVDIMDVDKLKTALATFEKGRHELRNKAILLLLLAFGMERRKICTLEWEKNYIKVSEEKRALKVAGRVYPMPGYLAQILELLRQEAGSKQYIFYSKDGKGPFKVGAINIILSTISEALPGENFYSYLTSANIRKSLAKYLLKNGYPLEKIYYLMDMEMNNLSNYFTKEEIINSAITGIRNIDCPIDCHPLESFFEELRM